MSMGVDQISNTSLLSQLEQMNKRMNAMSQSVSAYSGDFNGRQSYDLHSQAFLNSARNTVDQSANVNGVANTQTSTVQPTATAGQSVGEFKQLLKDAFENVNSLQNESSSMQSRFDVGDRSITLADVMIASQKSSLSFEATLQIRNKLVDAYQSIMQMQI